MARYIKNGNLYRINVAYASRTMPYFIECEDMKDLYREVAYCVTNGEYVISVVHILPDGTTPRVKVLSDKNYKRILREIQKEAKPIGRAIVLGLGN